LLDDDIARNVAAGELIWRGTLRKELCAMTYRTDGDFLFDRFSTGSG
jgi:hypothetical protein